MKKILVLGAGQSAPYMISYLLDKAEKYDWLVTINTLIVILIPQDPFDIISGCTIGNIFHDLILLAAS